MAIINIKFMPKSKEIIDLSGPNGNVFYLIAKAREMAAQLELNPDEIQKEMMSNDYTHAIETFDKHFGDYVDLYTDIIP